MNLDQTACQEKQNQIKNLFLACRSPEERYHLIMQLGRELPPLDPLHKIEANIVKGCQSIVYLYSSFEDGKMHFQASSEALISSGLAALLISVYDGMSPATVIKCPPTFLSELGIYASLSPARSNGLSSMYLRMQQDALKYFQAT